eukprot:12033638-Ditylum_brightwellii.AAC.1
MSTSDQFNQLDLGGGSTLTLSIIRAGVETNNSEANTSDIQKILPLILMELAHTKMGHRSIRFLLAGSLLQVWSDYKLAPKADALYEGCKIATSRSADRQHIGIPTP